MNSVSKGIKIASSSVEFTKELNQIALVLSSNSLIQTPIFHDYEEKRYMVMIREKHQDFGQLDIKVYINGYKPNVPASDYFISSIDFTKSNWN